MGIFNFFKKEDSVKKQKKQYLANLFYLAISDGEIHELEQKKINEMKINSRNIQYLNYKICFNYRWND